MDRGPTPNAPTHSTEAAPAWDGSTLADPHQRSDKADRVRDMFTAIAGSYDLNNRVHSFLLDQRWRKYTVKRAEVRPGDAVVDVACGTGDLAEAFARTPAQSVIGVDFTHAMLERAKHRQNQSEDRSITNIVYVEGDAMALPLADACCDVLSIAFGLRNVQEPKAAIDEFARVLRPGGRLVILEFDRPSFAPIRWGHDLYTKVIMPRTATWISRDRSGAYRYLPRSVQTFLSRERILDLMRQTGLEEVSAKSLSGGICACYFGRKP
ncbi:MAG: bifunctional demethylmenaquinone methyltransferase/2-methoxy-6-polyprenyl-1,4-benzoquinol methylase UbiE [Phycisphaerales bacterium]